MADESDGFLHDMVVTLRFLLREDVIPMRRIVRGRVDEQHVVDAQRQRYFAKERQILFGNHARGPDNRFLSIAVEILDAGMADESGVVIPQDDGFTGLPHALDTLIRIGAVADDVSQTVEMMRSAFLERGERNLESFQIAVNIRYESY